MAVQPEAIRHDIDRPAEVMPQLILVGAEQKSDPNYDLDELPPDTDIVRRYLTDIGKIELLTAAEEVELSKDIEAGVLAREALDDPQLLLHYSQKFADGDIGRLSNEFEELVEIGKAAQKRMVTANLRLVVSIAKKYQGNGVELLDIIQEANFGLVRAVEKFDRDKGFKFSTYATWWIKQACQRAIADLGRSVRIPVHESEAIAKTMRAARDLQRDFNREPTHAEIAEHLGISEAKVKSHIENSRSILSLDSPVGDNDATVGDFIGDSVMPDVASEVEDHARTEAVEGILHRLSPQQRDIIRKRMGLFDGRVWTLDQVGESHGRTRERIRQIEKQAIVRLKTLDETAALREFYGG